MKKTASRVFIFLFAISTLLAACGARTYTFNGKKSKNCGCPTHRGIIG